MLPEFYLTVSLSARHLARSARRAGMRVACIDAYADADTQAMAEGWGIATQSDTYSLTAQDVLDSADLLTEKEKHVGVVYGSGFESQAEVLDQLGQGRELLGNTPETLAISTDPARFFPLLDQLNIPYPEVRFESPTLSQGWLSKKAGASGGLHIIPAAAYRDIPGRYFQRLVRGESYSLLFLANGESLHAIGFNRALAPPEEAPSAWAYAGATRIAPEAVHHADEVLAAARALTRHLGLRGLNGIDFIVNSEGWNLLELNARPTATLALWDMAPMSPLFRLHVEACRGRLPLALPEMRGSMSSAVVYARDTLRIPSSFPWPDWCADIPNPGSVVDAGTPVCTVICGSPSADFSAQWVDEMRQSLLRRLSPYAIPTQVQTTQMQPTQALPSFDTPQDTMLGAIA